jgi:O-antigen/teichoic acid export membrane protein
LSGPRSYGRGAAVLSAGIGVTGLVTYGYFSLASHSLADDEYGRVTLLWSAVFLVVSVLYRPVEQLLSRTIAEREADGNSGNEHLRVAATIQLGLGIGFALAALVFRGVVEHGLFGGSSTLYWIFVVTVLAYAASYFARGFLAGHHRFGAYGALVLLESVSRCLFAVAVAVGITEGQSAVALGMVAAPLASLAVIPFVLARSAKRADTAQIADLAEGEAEFTLARGSGFAAAVLLIMLSEQAFLNAGPLVIKATEPGAAGAALAGFTFNVLLIARAPLQLFQSVQTSILPHLTKMRAAGEADDFARAVNVTLIAICAFAATVAIVLLAIGPWAMDLLFGSDAAYDRLGLSLIAIGMGLYLAAATLNQAALARGKTKEAAACWVTSAAAFVAFLLIPGWSDRVVQTEIGYAGAAAVLCALLHRLYRRPE